MELPPMTVEDYQPLETDDLARMLRDLGDPIFQPFFIAVAQRLEILEDQLSSAQALSAGFSQLLTSTGKLFNQSLLELVEWRKAFDGSFEQVKARFVGSVDPPKEG